MSEKFVTVATYNRTPEAHLAKNLLEEEGIASTLSGELTADMLPFGQAGGGDQIVLQVPESAARRAAGILATVAAAKLDESWEDEAESGSDVWICSICGEPISNRLSRCYSCQTPRESIRGSVPRDSTSIQRDPLNLAITEHAQKLEEQGEVAAAPPSSSTPFASSAADGESDETALSLGDDLARHVFRSALFGLCTLFLLPLAWYSLAKWILFTGEMSPRGRRYIVGGLLINGYSFLILLFLWSILRFFLR